MRRSRFLAKQKIFSEIQRKRVIRGTLKENEKEVIWRIVKRFVDCGFPIKTKQYDQPCMEGTFRILCFIKKSAEAVIINNKGMGRDGMSIQVRIDDRSTLGKIDSFSQNIKSQILNAGNCGSCSSKCESKKYVFTYHEKEYIKCHFLCNNFTFHNVGKNDVSSIVDIINNEIAFKQTRRKSKLGKTTEIAIV
jgi:hypothetical protein